MLPQMTSTSLFIAPPAMRDPVVAK